jgi:starch phosphorylase
VNNDPIVQDKLRVLFMPNYNVSLAELLIPAADLSEQISTAGKEASGTGNMKFCMNGALTIGTQDGANIEICREVGPENFFMFGLTAPEVASLRAGGYCPAALYEGNAELRQVLDLIRDGFFSRGDPGQFRTLVDGLLRWDTFMLLADFQSYVACQSQVGRAYEDVQRWTRMSILNVARCGHFSSDRAIREYADEIWRVPGVPIKLG